MYLLSVWKWLEAWDRWLFIRINSDCSNPVFDAVLPWFRLSSVWIPLYLFIFVFVLANYRKNSGWWIVFFVCTVALTDMIGNYGFKHNFQRLRPCNDPEFMPYVRLLINQCAGGYSFTSNHAANHFGMAAFVFATFRKQFPRWAWLGFLWAFIIVFTQVYVGVHYPLDVAGGTVLGLLIGGGTGWFFNKRFGLRQGT